MKTEAETIKDLQSLLDQTWSIEWGKRIDQFAPRYGKLQPADVAKLTQDELWKLWSADWFAKTGTPGFPNPDAKQWEGLRKMTTLLTDRSRPLGERFCAARDACKETFTAAETQQPVILRALLILEGGALGTVATKKYTNLLLTRTGKPELNYDDPASITEALKNVSALIKEWSAMVGAVTVGERARIAWHLCEMAEAELGKETKSMSEPKEIAIAALKKMLAEVGPDAEFPGDAIWEYAEQQVEPLRKSPVFSMLSKEGYIEPTGKKTNAVTPERRSAPATEYRFGPSLKPKSPAGDMSKVVHEFQAACEGNLKIVSGVVTRLVSSLLSKRFLILTGLAGSGKTKSAQAFARWITPDPGLIDTADPAKGKKPNAQYTLVPVGADWTGNENIVGYPDGLQSGSYVTKPALELIRHAIAHSDVPHFLILDEMNLSHVERYFADLLSAIESAEEIPLYQGDVRKSDGQDIPRSLRLPENLFIIGTVNVDETTYMFSPKVLDRANVIEFRLEPAELAAFLAAPAAPDLKALDGKGVAFGKDFVAAAADKSRTVPSTVKGGYETEMLLCFNLLRDHNAEFGYRTSYEAARFVHFYKLLGAHPDTSSDWFNGAIDCVIVQKLLPKLHGSRSKLEGLLWALAWACGAERKLPPAGLPEAETKAKQKELDTEFLTQCLEAAKSEDESKYGPEILWAALAKKNPDDPAKAARYSLSYDKVMRMWRKLVRDQFVNSSEA